MKPFIKLCSDPENKTIETVQIFLGKSDNKNKLLTSKQGPAIKFGVNPQNDCVEYLEIDCNKLGGKVYEHMLVDLLLQLDKWQERSKIQMPELVAAEISRCSSYMTKDRLRKAKMMEKHSGNHKELITALEMLVESPSDSKRSQKIIDYIKSKKTVSEKLNAVEVTLKFAELGMVQANFSVPSPYNIILSNVFHQNKSLFSSFIGRTIENKESCRLIWGHITSYIPTYMGPAERVSAYEMIYKNATYLSSDIKNILISGVEIMIDVNVEIIDDIKKFLKYVEKHEKDEGVRNHAISCLSFADSIEAFQAQQTNQNQEESLPMPSTTWPN